MCDELRVAPKEAAGAPETEIEVTPEMIEAGEMALWGGLCGSFIHPAASMDVLAKSVFLEMDKLRIPLSETNTR